MFGGFDSIMLNDVVRVELGKSKFKILSKCALVLFPLYRQSLGANGTWGESSQDAVFCYFTQSLF